MVSAAMLIKASVEQTNVRPVSAGLLADQGKTEDISFAKSFSDRLGESGLLGEKSSAKEPATVPPGIEVATQSPKKLDEATETLEGVETTTVVPQEISAHGGLKSVAPYKIVESQAPVVTGPQERIATVDLETKNVRASAETGEASDDVSPNSSASHIVPAADLTDKGVMEPVNTVVDEDRPLVPGVNSPVVQKEAANIGKTKEIASAEKIADVQEHTVASKTVQKVVRADGNAPPSKPAVTIAKEEIAPVFQGGMTGVVIPQNNADKATDDGLNKASFGIASVSTDVASAAANSSTRKETGRGRNVVAGDADTEVTSTGVQPVVQKPETNTGKIAAMVIPASSDGGDSKGQSAAGSSTSMIHSIVGSTLASGTAVVAGNTSGELSVAKLPVEEAAAHTAGWPVGSREQDRLGVVSAPMDEVPRMLTATPTALEVGIQNGTHGWLRVRAEMADGGVVNASVSAASSAGQEMLHRELPALTAYLQEEKVAVNAIAVHTPLTAGNDPRSSTGMDGAGGQTQQRGDEGGQPQQHVRKQMLGGSDGTRTFQSLHGVDEDGLSSLVTSASGGCWLSVRA